jgi:hypothetical protein
LYSGCRWPGRAGGARCQPTNTVARHASIAHIWGVGILHIVLTFFEDALNGGTSFPGRLRVAKVKHPTHHDGVRFANGAEVTLQELGPGVKGYVYNALSSPIWMPETAEAV